MSSSTLPNGWQFTFVLRPNLFRLWGWRYLLAGLLMRVARWLVKEARP